MKIVIAFIGLLTIFSCQQAEQRTVEQEHPLIISSQEEIKYAEGFTISQQENYKVLTIKNPWIGEGKTYRYILYKGEKPTGINADAFIKTPIKSIACMSLTHVSFIEKLNKENTIVALSGLDYVSSLKINEQIANGAIKEMGQGHNLNYEMLVEQHPDFIMGYGIDASSNNYMDKLQTLDLKIVLNSEYMETHPLGKAEWIKFIAAFYDEDELATSIFNKIEGEYLELVKLTSTIKDKPTVFTGMPWNGAWYIPGAKSFQAQILKDAGANYLWSEGNDEKSSLTKAKEIVIDEAYEADFWINQNSYNSVKSIVGYDGKFAGFKSIKNQKLYNNDKRLNDKSGNDYWETGVVQPQVVLKDLIKIFHPKLIEHELYYYRQLE